MKASVNWMKWYGGKGLDRPIDEIVQKIGAQLGGVEEFENLGEKYQGIIVVKVVRCWPHENSDHLNVCLIDDGGKAQDVERDEHGLVQVVCGAPNVREGLLVAWLPPGSTVPESVGKEPFVLGKRELRGVVSNGMIASARELAIGDSHDGILELDGDAKPGDDFAKAFGLDDYVIDIENKMFTHRPDCFGQLGIAREVGGINGQKFTSPDWYLHVMQDVLQQDGERLPLEIRNELPELVPRFMAIALSDITVKPSPVWLQTTLQRVGVRPISNVVDVTNYMMLLTGQPMHAYDYDKLKALDGTDKATIVVRHPRENEQITLLNGKTIDPRQEAIMIASDTKLIGVGGVMGGSETEVDENTKNIVLEVATFDMYSIRRTSMAHGLFTDAVSRFNKGQSPLQNDKLLAKAVSELRELTAAKVASEVVDLNQVAGREWVHPPVPVTSDFINGRLGLHLTADEMRQLLENVECSVSVDGENLTVAAPFWRTDIETREDVVEEIGRLYGYDKLPLELPRRSIQPVTKGAMLELKNSVREVLSRAGANEVLTYSFIHGDLLKKTGQKPEHAFRLSNALSPDLQFYRTGVTPSLLDKVHQNSKAGFGAFALFEMAKVHYRGEMDENEPSVPNEDDHLGLVIAYADKQQPAGAPYYYARRYLETVVDIDAYSLVALRDFDLSQDEWGAQLTAPYEPARSAVIVKDSQIWGVVGEFKPSVRHSLKLPAFTAGFEVHMAIVKPRATRYTPIPRFPTVTQDITLKVPAAVKYSALHELLVRTLFEEQPQESTGTLAPLDIYQREDDTEHKQLTFRLTIASYEKTMTDAEVNGLLDELASAAGEQFSAERL